ncbi:MAG: DUF2721 domain-containing protein [Bacteroidales bacterium]|jgi:hypothetical protein|nr:DUF2721 domain-containing protein [Bacteroidales bacterium]MDY0253367.1 DUF2721 domain-containing protein [Tenuifilaceae bacterium]
MLTLTTPTLLFSAISLLLLAYTNRFLALAQLIRNLHAQYKQNADSVLLGQINNLRIRVHIIRYMQILGITSLLLCVLSMFLIYIGETVWAEVIFGIALLLLIASLALSVWEIQISVKALDIHLSDIEKQQ